MQVYIRIVKQSNCAFGTDSDYRAPGYLPSIVSGLVPLMTNPAAISRISGAASRAAASIYPNLPAPHHTPCDGVTVTKGSDPVPFRIVSARSQVRLTQGAGAMTLSPQDSMAAPPSTYAGPIPPLGIGFRLGKAGGKIIYPDENIAGILANDDRSYVHRKFRHMGSEGLLYEYVYSPENTSSIVPNVMSANFTYGVQPSWTGPNGESLTAYSDPTVSHMANNVKQSKTQGSDPEGTAASLAYIGCGALIIEDYVIDIVSDSQLSESLNHDFIITAGMAMTTVSAGSDHIDNRPFTCPMIASRGLELCSGLNQLVKSGAPRTLSVLCLKGQHGPAFGGDLYVPALYNSSFRSGTNTFLNDWGLGFIVSTEISASINPIANRGFSSLPVYDRDGVLHDTGAFPYSGYDEGFPGWSPHQ